MIKWIRRLFGWHKEKYPKHLKQMCKDTKNSSRTKILSHGGGLKDHNCTVKTKPGDRCINGVWCWAKPEYGTKAYVGGRCSRRVITIACNPQTGAVHAGALEHEFAHWWLMNNRGDRSHNPMYKGQFWRWERYIS